MSEPTAGYAALPAAQVEVDDDVETHSTLEDDQTSASTSLTSSVLDFEWKHGRRYGKGQYSFPNDDTEQIRLRAIHYVFYRLLEDSYIRAPINPNGLNILDIGTGTGDWAIDVGDQYPGATITGNDTSPIQPVWVPPNVKFIVDDVEAEWVEPIKYDFIHCRYMAGSIKDWPRLLRQIYDNLKPGGWVELQESVNTLYSEDDSVKPNDPLVRMMDLLKDACNQIGRTMDPAPHFRNWLEDAGFTHIREERFKLPVGAWPKDPRLKEIGALMGINMREGVAAFTAVLFTDVLKWPREEVELFNMSVREASQRMRTHYLFDFLVTMGQKPE